MMNSNAVSTRLLTGRGSSLNKSELLLELEQLSEEKTARRAVRDAHFWLTHCTRTKDEQNLADPFRPFPEKPYIRELLRVLDHEPVVFIEKSRRVLASWTVAGWCAHLVFTHPATRVVCQSEADRTCILLDWEYQKPAAGALNGFCAKKANVLGIPLAAVQEVLRSEAIERLKNASPLPLTQAQQLAELYGIGPEAVLQGLRAALNASTLRLLRGLHG